MAKQFQLNSKNKLKFSVTVTLKKDVLDPQGKVVQNTLKNLGMNNLKNIRQGKYFEVEVMMMTLLKQKKMLRKCVKNF